MVIQTLKRVGGVLALAALTACASTGGKSAEAPQAEVKHRYSMAYVAGISVSLLDSAPDDKRLEDKKTLEMKLPVAVRESLTDEGLTVASADPGQQPGALLLKIAVDYDPGNRALRWMGGMFGAGKGEVHVKVEATDAHSGAVVAKEESSNTKRMGGAGGDFYEFAIDEVDEALEKLIEKLDATVKPAS